MARSSNRWRKVPYAATRWGRRRAAWRRFAINAAASRALIAGIGRVQAIQMSAPHTTPAERVAKRLAVAEAVVDAYEAVSREVTETAKLFDEMKR